MTKTNKLCTLERDVQHVNNTAYIYIRIYIYIVQKEIDFSKRATAPLKGSLDMWKCTLHSFKGHGVTFQGILHMLYGYCPCKNTLHCPKGKLYTLIQKGMLHFCFEYCICC